jgi:Protein of unknown function (DUF3592)
MRQVKLPADPRLAWGSVLFLGSVVVTAWAWGGLGWHARGMLLAAYGVAVALVLLLPALRTRRRLKAGVSAQGTVVGAEKRISSTGIGTWAPTFVPTPLYHPRVRFTTPDGRTVVFTSALGSPDSELELGRPVPVRYHPDNPQQAQVDTPWARMWAWILPGALGLLGGLGCWWPESSCTCRSSQPWRRWPETGSAALRCVLSSRRSVKSPQRRTTTVFMGRRPGVSARYRASMRCLCGTTRAPRWPRLTA